MNNKKSLVLSVATIITAFGFMVVAVPALAQTSGSGMPAQSGTHRQWGGGPGKMGAMKPGVIGTVASINGTTLTLNGRQGFGSTTAATSFTVDAGNATVIKNNATSTLSSVAVGDMIFAQGMVSGTNVTATTIRDGIMGPGTGRGMNRGPRTSSSTPQTSPITGNGEPIVAGTISAINGSTITLTNQSNVEYSVDATNAKIVQGQNTISVSSLAVGNSVVVQGTVNGNAVTASSVIDQTKPAGMNNQAHPGFFQGIGQFFKHLFGF